MGASGLSVELEGRTAVVTGASTGIGRATARRLADRGVRVGLAARTESRLATLADEIADGGGEALVIPTDVRDREAVRTLIERTDDTFGPLDIVVNNAGVVDWEHPGVLDGDVGSWQREIEVNLLGVMYGTYYGAQTMVPRGSGDIVNLSSMASRFPFAEWPGYVASKYGVRGFTGAARRDLQEAGVRVTLLEPGEVATPIQTDAAIEERYMLEPADVADAIIYAISQPDPICVTTLQVLPSWRD